ncbi:MAG: pyruvate dehydrogenase complex dihydrolipoamide acetyltransferase [Flavobacteriales bacterium]|nr:pyruvate dehydrogenase complex dihydrolipoamide acetyltransferase [Flavobacteriales bacterium]
MAEVVTMPKLSDTMTEGVVAKWHKKVGDKVKSGDLLADIETDKATMEFESFSEGILLHIGVPEGGTAPVDSLLAVLGKEGENIADILKQHAGGPAASAAPAPQKESQETASAPVAAAPAESKPTTSSETSGRVFASPLAKSIAKEKGIDLTVVKGSGEGGRIVKRDVEEFSPSAKASKAAVSVGTESYEDVPLSQMRKTIARRLAESKFSAPHFYLTMDIDMDNAMAARKAINEMGAGKISFNDLVIKAVALALKKHPKVNASWLGDKIRYNHHVHIGVAVAVEDGLVVPVIKFADTKSLQTLNEEVKTFASKAREKKIQPADMEGNTFTISNLGMYGIDQFTAIINPPDSCIMAVGAIRQEPVVKNGQVVPGNRMKVTLSCDHRSVDGATGSEFLLTFRQLLENPYLMI